MEKDSKKSFSEKLGSLTSIMKNLKFLVLTTIALVVLGLAITSGDGRNIALGFYENVTGKKYKDFSPVQDQSNETYLILKGKLSRDTNINVENAVIFIFKESDTLHRYRVEVMDEIYFYNVEKKQNGIWRINNEK